MYMYSEELMLFDCIICIPVSLLLRWQMEPSSARRYNRRQQEDVHEDWSWLAKCCGDAPLAKNTK